MKRPCTRHQYCLQPMTKSVSLFCGPTCGSDCGSICGFICWSPENNTNEKSTRVWLFFWIIWITLRHYSSKVTIDKIFSQFTPMCYVLCVRKVACMDTLYFKVYANQMYTINRYGTFTSCDLTNIVESWESISLVYFTISQSRLML